MDWLAAWAHGVPCCARRRPGAEAPASAQSWPVEFADGLALLVPAGGWSGLTPARYYDSHLSRWVPIAEQQLRRGTFQKLFFEGSTPLESPQIAPLTPDVQYLEGEDLTFWFHPAGRPLYELCISGPGHRQDMLLPTNCWKLKGGLPAGRHRLRVRWVPAPTGRPEAKTRTAAPWLAC